MQIGVFSQPECIRVRPVQRLTQPVGAARNDADRLRKYLLKFGLNWERVRA
jgi:sigma54-dependent transcription regulator